jgi:hypothetical protein
MLEIFPSQQSALNERRQLKADNRELIADGVHRHHLAKGPALDIRLTPRPLASDRYAGPQRVQHSRLRPHSGLTGLFARAV